MKFHIYRDKAGEYRWRLVARNGRIRADSGEGYTRKYDCQRAIWGAIYDLSRMLGFGMDMDWIRRNTPIIYD